MPKFLICTSLIFGALLAESPALGQDKSVEPAERPTLFETEFRDATYGRIPLGWRDLIDIRPSRNWAVDGNALLRPMPKDYTGLLVYEGYLANAKPARTLTDGVVSATFKTTGDAGVCFGLVGRVQDKSNFYFARLVGDSTLQLVKVVAGEEKVLSQTVASRRYHEGERWRLSLTLQGDHSTAQLVDAKGKEAARVDALDAEFTRGCAGLRCTTYAAAASFSIVAIEPIEALYSANKIAKRNERLIKDALDYPVVKPMWQFGELNTPPAKLAAQYDVVVCGAGTGGFGAAVQASRLGARVLLLEETDWIGGQMCAAAVTSMDEDSVWRKFPVRERGLYREFHESMVTYYRTLDKDPFVAYYGQPQSEGGYEPKAARAMLYGFIADARARRFLNDGHGVLDLSLRSRVTRVHKQGDTVKGVTITIDSELGSQQKELGCKVLIDATEYGDVIPLTGARYRVGNVTSEKLDPQALVQDHTWTAVVREYPDGVPTHLQLREPPPGYEQGAARRYRKFQLYGLHIWGAAGKGIKGPRDYRVFFAWRGMADADSPLTGERSGLRHTQCGFNGGNDYPVTVATCEDPAQRRRDEREGIYRTLGALYYFQRELGLNWSLTEDEGYDTPYNRAKMKSLELRPDLEAIAVHLPQMPYVREARRIMGVRTLVAADLTRYEQAKHFATSVAMGDYFMDLDHGKTAHAIETDLDSAESPHGGGPFQVPFEVFLPEKLDGFLPAEKNFSQSRLANGATRLQPITMLTGQAVGTIAALSSARNVQPRELDPRQVQSVLLDSGCTLIQRWYADVPWGTPIWKATQLLSLHQVMDRPGAIDKDNAIPLGSRARWGVNEPLRTAELRTALARLVELKGVHRAVSSLPDAETVSVGTLQQLLSQIEPRWGELWNTEPADGQREVTAGEFAQIAAKILLQPAIGAK